jgi:hypothetical protein
MHDLLTLWQAHRDEAWPKMAGAHEGALMTLDTVISGCMTYYLDTAEGLDPQRVEILRTCLGDLENLLPEVEGEALAYFERLRMLAETLLEASLK